MLRGSIALLAAVLVTAAFFICREALAAAWTIPYGSTQVIKTYSFYSTEFNSSSTNERLLKLEYKPMVEVGASNNLTVGLAPSFENLTSVRGRSVSTNLGFTNVDMFFRYKLWSDDFTVFSIQPLVKMFGAYDDGRTPNLGPKQVDAEIRGLMGRSFNYNNRWHYINLETAYRKRFESPGDEFRFDATLGYRFYPGLTIMPQIFSIFSVEDSKTRSGLATNSTDFDLVKLQLSFIKDIGKKHAVQFGAFSHVHNENTGGGGGVLLSYWMRF